jgi:hypothetical protein
MLLKYRVAAAWKNALQSLQFERPIIIGQPRWAPITQNKMHESRVHVHLLDSSRRNEMTDRVLHSEIAKWPA